MNQSTCVLLVMILSLGTLVGCPTLPTDNDNGVFNNDNLNDNDQDNSQSNLNENDNGSDDNSENSNDNSDENMNDNGGLLGNENDNDNGSGQEASLTISAAALADGEQVDFVVGRDQTVTLECTQTDSGVAADLGWLQTEGPTTDFETDMAIVELVDLQDGATYGFECTATRDEEVTAAAVQFTIDFCESGFFVVSNRTVALSQGTFVSGQAITAATTLTGSETQPPGLSATATSDCVEDAQTIAITWECMSGPSGAADCMFVDIPTPSVLNDGTIVTYVLSPAGGAYDQLTPSGELVPIENIPNFGDYTFMATAEAAGVGKATGDVTYTILPAFTVLIPTSAFNALEGIVLSDGEPTTRVLETGSSIDVPYTLLVRTGGTVAFSLSSDGLEFADLNSANIQPQEPAALDTLIAEVSTTEVGKHTLYVALDSDLGSQNDTAATDTGVTIVVGAACNSDDDCAVEEYCFFEQGKCDTAGVCAAIAEPCITTESDPVCGCDGETYEQACEAEAAGVSVDFDGSCVPD